jgi:hypothetical protein
MRIRQPNGELAFSIGTSGPHTDYIGMYMGPDGTPWVGYNQMCTSHELVAKNPVCKSAPPPANPIADGKAAPPFMMALVGRLAR